jgi:uncharacterized protein YndB with AHSA1/START domain
MLEPLRSSATASLTRDPAGISDREIIISRLFDAPRELVFDAWADPEHIAEWWGPQGFTTTTEKFDFRVGGQWIHVMRGPDGREYPNESVFLDIVRPERIVRTHGGGNLKFKMTVTFIEENGKTRLTLHHVFPSAEMREFVVREHNAIEGGKQTLERLANYLAKPKAVAGYELHISRMLNAPREIVYKAFTDPAMLTEWMGPRGFLARDIEQDLRAGGKWKLRLHRTSPDIACDAGDATDLWMRGTYLEVVSPERLVYTFTWENRSDIPIYETTITVTFRELEGKTVLDFKQGPFDSAADRDGHNIGWSSAFDRFAEFLASPTPPKETRSLVIDRVFDAPRELVWKVWTDPEHAKQWAGPRGFACTHFEQDDRVGGRWRLCIHSDGLDTGDGQLRVLDLWQGGVFREIVPMERIVYTFTWDNMSDMSGVETVVTITFKDIDGKTAMRFEQTGFPNLNQRDGHTTGWNSAFDKFNDYLLAEKQTRRA